MGAGANVLRAMDTNRPGIQLLRWTLAVVLEVVALWLLNLAAGHYWAAGGPPCSDPEWYVRQGNTLLAASVVAFVGGLAIWWLLRRRETSPSV